MKVNNLNNLNIIEQLLVKIEYYWGLVMKIEYYWVTCHEN